ncbi:unnamed protein product, partial [Adineta steineri]
IIHNDKLKVAIIKRVLSNALNSRITKLLSDANINGIEVIQSSDLIQVIDTLLSEANNHDKDENDFIDEEEERERRGNLLKELFKLAKDGQLIDHALLNQLAAKHKVSIGK